MFYSNKLVRLLLIAAFLLGCTNDVDNEVPLLDGSDFASIPMFKNGNDFVGEIKREINAGNESLSVLIKIGEPDSVYMVWASLDKVMSKATEMPCFKISEASPDWKAFKVGQGITQELSKIYAFRFLDKQGKMVTLRTRNSTVK